MISTDGSNRTYGATNAELDALAIDLKVPNYVRCRMKNELRGLTAAACECSIVNLQNTDQAGSHWVLYFTDSVRKIAYSSYGDQVPQELVEYLGHTPAIFMSDIQIQNFSETSCGYYCIAIFLLFADGDAFEDIVLGFKSCRFPTALAQAERSTLLDKVGKPAPPVTE